jgi:hypothetical protein
MPTTSAAKLETTSASRYLGQFCKHFAHRVPVNLAHSGKAGIVTFEGGICTLRADDTALDLRLDAASAEDAERLQAVIDSHLARFAFRENPALVWQNPG